MELKETKMVLKRIQNNYSSFVVDNYLQSEWHKELSKYDLEDVMEKLEQHFRSEQYGNQIPKLYYLTKYLKTTKEKQEEKVEYIYCNLCHEAFRIDEFDEHYDRCSSVNYFLKQYKKYFEKYLEREKLMNMSEEEFETNYAKLLKIVMERTTDEKESRRISFIFNPPTREVSINEIM